MENLDLGNPARFEEERQLQRSWEQLQSGECGLPVMTNTQDDDLDQEVPALNALIAILDEEEKEEQEFEQLKPYLPELGTKATSSIVPAGKDGSNPFVTQAVEVFQRFYPDVDLSSAFGDHYKEVLRAAAHRSARGGHIEQLQLRNVQRAEEERRAQEERRKLLRELRQRRYLIQERQRALGSLGDTKISTKVRASMPEALHAASSSGASLGGAPNGLLFPDMDGTSFPSCAGAAEPAVCFPRTTTASETLPAKAKTKPHCRTSSASSKSQLALPDFICQLQIAVGTAGLHVPAPAPSGHCWTSSASNSSQWALPDFICQQQIAVGTAGLHVPAPDRSGHCHIKPAKTGEGAFDLLIEILDRIPGEDCWIAHLRLGRAMIMAMASGSSARSEDGDTIRARKAAEMVCEEEHWDDEDFEWVEEELEAVKGEEPKQAKLQKNVETEAKRAEG
eukprot:s1270_g5.t1